MIFEKKYNDQSSWLLRANMIELSMKKNQRPIQLIVQGQFVEQVGLQFESEPQYVEQYVVATNEHETKVKEFSYKFIVLHHQK